MEKGFLILVYKLGKNQGAVFGKNQTLHPFFVYLSINDMNSMNLYLE